MKDKPMNQQTIETVASVSSKISYSGAGGAVFFGLTANEFAALVGAVVAVIGLIVNIYYKHKADKMMQRHYAKLDGE